MKKLLQALATSALLTLSLCAAALTPAQERQIKQAMAARGGSNSGSAPASAGEGMAGLFPAILGTGHEERPTPTPRVAPVLPPLPAVTSDVFGAHLFTGAFAREGATQFHPDYVVTTGDTLQIRMWGAFNLDTQAAVDPQGNIFLPNVGPVGVRGVRNQELQAVVEQAVRKVYRANVSSYASLAEAQPVRIFVSGFVPRPGQYSGTSMDSLLHYLDQAGGIDPERGSFLNVRVQRNGQIRGEVNLYDFLLSGTMPVLQLASGDVIFVPHRQNTVKVGGLAANARRFEFATPRITVGELMPLSRPEATATHVRVVRNTGLTRNTEYFALNEAAGVSLGNGDEVEFTSDKKPGTITVRVEGEHQSPQEYVLPYGTKLGDLVQRIELNERSEADNVQLFRLSVKQRQKELLATSLRSLEAALLTARSGSSAEATLRHDEANLALQWVDRARSIEPLGQVLIAQSSDRDQLMLENGDVLKIPARDALVLISGEVLFPNAVAHQSHLSVKDYIDRAGGYTQNGDHARVVVARRNGAFDQIDTGLLGSSAQIRPGDQILVLPRVDDKNRQFWKDMTQIIYQIAVSAKVVFGL